MLLLAGRGVLLCSTSGRPVLPSTVRIGVYVVLHPLCGDWPSLWSIGPTMFLRVPARHSWPLMLPHRSIALGRSYHWLLQSVFPHVTALLAHHRLSHITGLLSGLAAISILSSYSFLLCLTYLLASLVLTFPHLYSPLFMTPLYCYNCTWLISYLFDSIPFASDSYLADASACRFLVSLHVLFLFYDSILLYLYKYCSKRSKSLQTWSPL